MAKIHINNPKQVINGGAKKYYFKVKGLGGPKGDKGDKGDTGATGPEGPQGNAATVSIGSTTTLPVGYDATVTNSGSIYNAVLNFGIPQGPRGPQGATGAKGDKGDKGDQGNPGPQGEKGTNATVTVGTTTTTEPGTQAYAWNSSSNPNNAVINFNIPRGATGATGATGPQGPTGPAGADGQDGQDGQNFTPTIVDTLPTVGDQGKLYLTPKAHTTQTATGNPINVNITDNAGKIESLKLNGDTFQQTYTGQNLYNVATLQTGTYVTKDDDGWITITRDNTSGSSASYINAWTSNLALETSTQYVIFLEIKDVSGTGEFDITSTNSTQGQFSSWQSKQISSLAAGQVYKVTATTKSSFSGITGGLRTLLNLSAGQSASITFRLSVLADTSTTTASFVYEPYTGGQASPNPDYPQPIQTVTGEQTVTINSTAYPISLGSLELCKIGTYQDYIWKDGESWKVHKATVSAIIDGSESWDTSGTNTFYVANIYSKIGNSIQSASTGEMYASHFTIVDITSSNTLVGASLKVDAAHNVSNLRIRLQDMSGGTAGFKQMLSAKKPSIYARRLTPTDTTITDTTLIAQLEAIRTASLENGTNTITNTATGSNLAGDMKIGYFGFNPNNRYDKWLWLNLNNNYEQIGGE